MDIQLLDRTVPDILTPMEAAKILHIGRSTMYQLLAKEEIRNFKIKTKILIPKSFLQNFKAKSAEINFYSDIQIADRKSTRLNSRHMA